MYRTESVAVVDLTTPQVVVRGAVHAIPDIDIVPKSGGGALGAEIAHFCACVRGGYASSLVTLEDAFHGVQVATAMISSAAAGGAVIESGR